MAQFRHTVAAAALAVCGLTVQAQAQTVNIAPAYPSTAATTSFIRLYNASAAATGTFTISLRADGGSTVVATWSGSLAPRSSTAVKLGDIEAQNSIAPPANGALYSVAVSANVAGYAQHAVFRNADRTWMNLSACGAAAAAPAKTLIGVHEASSVSVSSIVLHNTGAAAKAATLTIYDFSSGQAIGTWTSPALLAGAFSAEISAAQILAEARVPSAQRSYVTLVLDDAFTGYAQHLVRSVNSATQTDMTTACALNVSAAGA